MDLTYCSSSVWLHNILKVQDIFIDNFIGSNSIITYFDNYLPTYKTQVVGK